ncbi:hypothetical protein BX666DRAFT_1900790 [Dichotomocladium elegans]|nr:hypothetical protein BX666DRAFT_1900790 [Dichotomocladium elegans]
MKLYFFHATFCGLIGDNQKRERYNELSMHSNCHRHCSRQLMMADTHVVFIYSWKKETIR